MSSRAIVTWQIIAVVLFQACQDIPFIPAAQRSSLTWITTDCAVGPRPARMEEVVNLSAAGIRSVISVDAIGPPIQWLNEEGIIPVHIPLTYAAMERTSLDQLIVAVRDLPRPLYIHCHHGRYRAPSAAAAVLLAHGTITVQEAVEILQKWSVQEAYPVMAGSVLEAQRRSPSTINAMTTTLHEKIAAAPLVETMAALDVAMFALTEAPVSTQREEAGLIDDLLRIVPRRRSGGVTIETAREWDHLLAMARQESDRIQSLAGGSDPLEWRSGIAELAAACTACHRRFRDGR
jgi:hypothetical protein